VEDGYNRDVKLSAVVLAAALLCACSKNIQTSDAVQAGVMEYLNAKAAQTGLDMSAMQVDVASVSFEKDKAFATVAVKPKNFPTSAMQINYTLDRKGDKWVVRPESGSGNPHAAGSGGTAMPPGHPATVNPDGSGDAAPGGGALPPGHPAVGKSQ
jgi:hypothetical protein